MSTTPLIPRKKRSLKFLLKLALGVIVGLPLLAYLSAWAYINFGFLNSTIETRIGKKFGTAAHVASMKSGVLGGMDIGELSVEARDMGAPFTIASAAVEWDLKSLLVDDRLRAITLDQ